MQELVQQLEEQHFLNKPDMLTLLQSNDESDDSYLFERARAVSTQHYGQAIFTRGLIEFSNFCKNNCYYCGIRLANRRASRYRLSKEEIMSCCDQGYELNFRTFVLQSGEDPWYTDEKICEIINEIKGKYPDCALTLSIGEKTRLSYQAYFDAGADRFLLRHETADPEHYRQLHPSSLSLENRKRCLYDLKEIGYQVGTGFMVGSPYQSWESLWSDLSFIKEFQPAMVGIGPFIPHKDTRYKDYSSGNLVLTLRLLAVIRLMLPKVLLPATTALGTIDENGRELGILSGANVVMPNLSPTGVRKKYALYDNKICTGDEAAQCRSCLEMKMKKIGYHLTTDRGDSLLYAEELQRG